MINQDLPHNFYHTIDGIDYKVEYTHEVRPKTYVYVLPSGDLYFYVNDVFTASQIFEMVSRMRKEYARGFLAGKKSHQQEMRSKLGL